MTDRYKELTEDARSALYNLLRDTEPGTGGSLHIAYRALKAMVEEQTKAEEEPESHDSMADFRRECRERSAAWKEIGHADRARLIFEVIGDGRSTVTEVTAMLEERLGDGVAVYQGTTRQVLMRLLSEGELDREPEHFQGKIRYRFFRNTNLAGPIADLERTFHDDVDAEGER